MNDVLLHSTFERQPREGDENYLERVSTAAIVMVLNHYILIGHPLTKIQTASCIYDIHFTTCPHSFEISFKSWLMRVWQRTADEQVFATTATHSAEHQVALLSGAILFTLLCPEGRLTLEVNGTRYVLNERGLYRMGTHPMIVWSRDLA